MEPLQHAIVLNNMGAHLFDVQNTMGALQAFQEAIHILKDSVVTTGNCTTTSTTTTTTMNIDDGGRTINCHRNNMQLLQESLQCVPSIVMSTTTMTPGTTTSTTSTTTATIDARQRSSDNMTIPASTGSCCGSHDGSSHDRNCSNTRKKQKINHPDIKNGTGSYEYYIHDRALTVPTTLLQQRRHHSQLATAYADARMEVQIRTASIVILYNFAMACHQWGKQSCGPTAYVLQALRVYKLVVQMILQQVSPTTTSSGGTYLRVVLCLALNNMVSIHYDDFCDYDNGLICIEYIQKMLLRHSNMMDTIALQFLASHEWDDIKLNALIIQSPSAAHAA